MHFPFLNRLILPIFLLLTVLPATAAPPAAPTNLTLSAPFVSTLRLEWTDNSNDENGFELSIRIGNGEFTSVGNVAANTTSIDLNGATPNTTYSARVRAFIAAGPEFSGYTEIATITTPGFVNPPATAAPIVAGTLPAIPSLTAGTPPAEIPLTGLFEDPDVQVAARLTTSMGEIDFAFYPNSAPLTVANFLGYLSRGDFINTIFHRSVPDFIIQAGAFRADATASAVPTDPPVTNEPSITNVRGTVAMAKLGGNPDSATNQFFINLANNSGNLNNQNGGFTVFARVAGNGMTVADAIAALPIRDYKLINAALTHTPVQGTPPPAYDPSTLVRIISTAIVEPLAISVTSSQPAIATAAVTGTNLTLNPLSPGTTTITLTATDLDNQTVSTSFALNVTDSDPYQAWVDQQNFANPADAAAGADPDLDGLVNLLEWSLAAPPLTGGPQPWTAIIENQRLSLIFSLTTSSLGTTTVQLESAESPTGPWTSRWTSTDGFSHPWIASTLPGEGLTVVTARDPEPVTSAPRRFLRLRVTGP